MVFAPSNIRRFLVLVTGLVQLVQLIVKFNAYFDMIVIGAQLSSYNWLIAVRMWTFSAITKVKICIGVIVI